jgi:hypothetical protein
MLRLAVALEFVINILNIWRKMELRNIYYNVRLKTPE